MRLGLAGYPLGILLGVMAAGSDQQNQQEASQQTGPTKGGQLSGCRLYAADQAGEKRGPAHHDTSSKCGPSIKADLP